ncbi:hypothetical protein BSI_39830 [Bacillus inaquosorum KCTC 13429]|uniref:Uncharacterized protein n=1 Tax=Bacillus inaquosorum KCTC 13429 TaxID=1236548 RepID=A0A9W5LF78_9BACI|nr:hypothetical protein BSI_39830 [Bacillus inaquosorum KCTC 13429]
MLIIDSSLIGFSKVIFAFSSGKIIDLIIHFIPSLFYTLASSSNF